MTIFNSENKHSESYSICLVYSSKTQDWKSYKLSFPILKISINIRSDDIGYVLKYNSW